MASTGQQMRVKVSVEKLITAIETRRAEMVATFEQAQAKYPNEVENWKVQWRDRLVEWGRQVEMCEKPDTDSYHRPRLSEPPREPVLNVSSIDRDLATLRMAADETILVTPNDFGCYLS